MTLELQSNPDILATLAGDRREDQVIVRFALETHDAVRSGEAKRIRKGADLMVVNEAAAALDRDTNTVTLVDGGEPLPLPEMSKLDVARHILDWVVERRRRGQPEPGHAG